MRAVPTEGQRIVECWNRWLETDEGNACISGAASMQYLRNRIERAFQQGWADGRIDAKLSAAPAPVDGPVDRWDASSHSHQNDGGTWSAGINDSSVWGHRIQVHADTIEEAEALRDQVLAALQSRDEGWIAVSERNPKERGEYLVYQPIEGVRTMRYGTSVKWDMGRNKCRPPEDRVSHWMPLPTPPRKP